MTRTASLRVISLEMMLTRYGATQMQSFIGVVSADGKTATHLSRSTLKKCIRGGSIGLKGSTSGLSCGGLQGVAPDYGGIR